MDFRKLAEESKNVLQEQRDMPLAVRALIGILGRNKGEADKGTVARLIQQKRGGGLKRVEDLRSAIDDAERLGYIDRSNETLSLTSKGKKFAKKLGHQV